MGDTIQIKARDGSGSFAAYAAGPADARAAIIVIQEIFGINPGIRQMVDGWAAKGYRAVAPDLFWRLQPGIELDADIPEQFQQAIGFYQKFDVDKGIADIEATITALRHAGVAKVGAVGYCLGGLLAYLTATRTDSDATVGYYGVGIDGKLGEAHAIARPLLLHIATKDGFVAAEAQAKVHAELDGHPRVTLYDYEADHAFARAIGSSRVEALAVQADARTTAFFAQHLV
jgi:carboxymethylenebutenolidase